MESTCRRCQDEFTVTGEDLDFYAQLSPVFDGRRFELPPPSFCPDCRHQQRLAFRNERRLFRRPCSATGRQIISIFPENSPYKVLANEVWWGSSWDARDFGRSYDFSRPFFEQFRELHRDIPKQALIATNNENSDYVNYALNCRDCYLLLGWGENNEHCMYGRLVVGCRDCIDISNARDCELCCHSTDISTCYRLFYSQSCKQCSDSWYLKNCLACSDCFGCINLSHRRYCIFNEQYSREDYDLRLKAMREKLRHPPEHARLEKEIDERFSRAPHKYYQGMNTEQSTGDYLTNCKNCFRCFDTVESEDSAYLYDCIQTRCCRDLSVAGKNRTEMSYQCVNYTGYHCLFVSLVWLSSDLIYCQDCFQNTHDCFGCSGLKQASHCILNKQYPPQEYQCLCRKIIEQMQENGEWGHFFPASLAPYAYNDSMAQEYYPLSAAEARSAGYDWRDDDAEEPSHTNAASLPLPASPRDFRPEMLGTAWTCEATGRGYKINSGELKFYVEHELPLPRVHPDERHRRRLGLRNPRRLYDRQCAQCAMQFQSTFAPGRPERVLCETCFQKFVF